VDVVGFQGFADFGALYGGEFAGAPSAAPSFVSDRDGSAFGVVVCELEAFVNRFSTCQKKYSVASSRSS
jgi:hypothetical protein